jgi:RNA polymerase sigma-70 factor, ECF subfamily
VGQPELLAVSPSPGSASLWELLSRELGPLDAGEREELEAALFTAAGGAAQDEPASWIRFVAEQVRGEADGARALRSLALADLYLAFGCLAEHPRALAAFETEILAGARAWIRRIDASTSFVDEAIQSLRIKLLAGSRDRGPYLERYAGRGPLAAWVRTVAVGVAVDLLRQRSQATRQDDDSALAELSSPEDPELDLIKAQHRAAFRGAFKSALLELAPRDRTLIRLRYLEGLTTEEMATMFQTHRTTVMRWLQRIGAALLENTRRRLIQQLRLSTEDVARLFEQLHSRVDLSLERIIGQSAKSAS